MKHPTRHTERQQLQILDKWWDTLRRHLASLQELVLEDPPTAHAIIRLTDTYAQCGGNHASATPKRAQPAKVLSFDARRRHDDASSAGTTQGTTQTGVNVVDND